VDFSEARDLFGIIFQIPRSDCKFMDCGLILKKPRGLSAKCPKLDFPGIVIPKENPWTALARSTVDWRPMPRSGARQSSASDRSGARELRPRGGGEEGRVGKPKRLGRRWKGISPAAEASARKGALEVWEA
jgi:hypothetical protein